MKTILHLVSLLAVAATLVACGKKDEGTNACEGITCNGHGACVEVAGNPGCACETGYHAQGLNCISDSDPCDGITCSGFGTCVAEGTTASCDCDPNYHAVELDCVVNAEPCDGVTCSDHGTCVEVEGSPSCACENGYHSQGLTCLPDDDPCAGITCSNHGLCVDDGDGTASCDCDPDYHAVELECVSDDTAPTITSVPPTDADLGVELSYDVVCEDLELDALTLTVGPTDDCGGTLIDGGDGTGTYSFTPPIDLAGTTCTLAIQCSDGALSADQTSPITVNGLGFISISNSGALTCAIDNLGAAWCWGGNYVGQLGDDTTTARHQPTAAVMPVGVAFTQVTTGSMHVCALDSAGSAWCWGYNEYGQLGNYSVANSRVPTAVTMPVGHSFTQIAAGGDHTCALDSTGAAWCWGDNQFGASGDGTLTNSNVPTEISMPAATTFTRISTSWYFSCAVSSAGAAWCWGMNDWGQLGDDSTTQRLVPTAVVMPPATTLTDITAGSQSACALDDTGAAWCWGDNGWGQLGDGTTTQRRVPTAITMPAGRTFTALQSGDSSACGIDDLGAAWCWGSNGYGRLGDGTNTTREIPTAVSMPAATTFGHITVGAFNACGLDAAGASWCWGRNSEGQIGDGTVVDEWVPTRAIMP